jgi:hypothetical protein
MVIPKLVPWVPEFGVIEVMVGAAELATLNPFGLVNEPPSVVTITSLKPTAAVESMFTMVVI